MSKDTFIIKTEWKEAISELPLNEQGLLLQEMMNYHSTGKLSEGLPLSVKLIFKIIKPTFDKNSDKYHNSIVQGKIGNLKKHHPEIYERFMKEEISLEEAEATAYPHKNILARPPIAPRPDPITPDRYYDSDNVNVSDNVNDNDYSKNNICRKSGDSRPNEKIEDEISKKKINEEFEKVWKSYLPVKTSDGGFTPKGDKKPALAEFEKIYRKTKDPNVFEEIATGVQNYLRQCSNSGTKTKHFVRFLRNETWKDHQSFDEPTIIASGGLNKEEPNFLPYPERKRLAEEAKAKRGELLASSPP